MNNVNRQVRTRALAQLAGVGLLVLFGVTGVGAQLQPPPAPWRGAGPTPRAGADGGGGKSSPGRRSGGGRARGLFHSKNGTQGTKEGVGFSGERITEVGPPAPGQNPAGTQG